MSHRRCYYCSKEYYHCNCTPLTPWEAGNILADLQDVIAEKITDLNRGKQEEIARSLKPLSEAVGKLFNTIGAHSFKLPEGDGKE